MKRYITRHGQVGTDARYYQNNPMFPMEDEPLSELGIEQARLLGERLRGQNFCGVIYASPFLRTMETAQVIAEVLDCPIYPCADIQESHDGTYTGKPLAELRERFSRIADDATLDDDWWVIDGADDWGGILNRCNRALQHADIHHPNEEVLFVGHGATAVALTALTDTFWNCALTTFDPMDHTNTASNDVSHLPDEMVTTNILDREYYYRRFAERQQGEK